ncbi:endoribonuclease YbeY [Bacilli bacterium]|nr:endoribonuclease YbeY [Bacilli bacterium]
MIEIEITIEDKKWLKFIKIPKLKTVTKKLFSFVLELLGCKVKKNTTVAISIILTNDEKITILNKNYRNTPKPTNVLSFPMYEREFAKALKYEPYIFLGDVVLSLETIERESLGQNKFFDDHLHHLIVHSLLHLLGFDHREDKDAEVMEDAEKMVLDRLKEHNKS